ncbi:MAG TPA: NADH-quinone oxidoreductase subunit N [Planctomycetaceae bacterium]|nr:NADH-quinone oxidoreductase subunit N [Planctomycetaceae bacterium]
MLTTFSVLLPQTILIGAACLFFLGGTFPIKRSAWGPLALVVLLAGAIAMAARSTAGASAHGSLDSVIVADSLANVFNWFFLATGAVFTLLSLKEQSESDAAAEFYGLLLTITGGMMVVSSANELILMFLGLELISVPTYVILYLGRRDLDSRESATKYFLLSVMSAAILLYGFSFLYGLTGTTNFNGIREVLARTYTGFGGHVPAGTGSQLGILALLLIFAGLGFKVAAVPFHFYAPDVYQGTSAFNAGLLAVAPKAAGFVALVRIASVTPGFEAAGETIAVILALFTMTGGNILALLQTNIRRMLAYSSIAHAGYMMIGVAVGFWDSWNPQKGLFGLPGGIQSCLFYLIAYSLVTAGLFAVLVYLSRPGKQVENIEELTGLSRTHPLVALCAALFLFSLAGLPPLPGFWGKLTVFAGAVGVRGDMTAAMPLPRSVFIALAIAGALNAAIGGVYYLRVIAVMFLHDPLTTPEPKGGKSALAAVYLTALATIFFSVDIRPLFEALRTVEIAGPNAMTAVQDEDPAPKIVQDRP